MEHSQPEALPEVKNVTPQVNFNVNFNPFCFGQAAAAATYVARLSAIYARLSKVLTPDELKLACDKHATVVANVQSARNALYKLRHEYHIKELREPLSNLKALDTFESLRVERDRNIRELGDHHELITARDDCAQLMQATAALYGEHGHPDAHEAIIMRNVVGKPGTLDVLAANSGHTTRQVDGVVYTVLTPRSTHFGAVGPLLKPRDPIAGQGKSPFPLAPERIGTITSDPAETIQEFRRATDAANLGCLLGLITGSMMRALGTPGAADGQRTLAQINVPERELLAITRVWNFVAGEVSACHNEDRHLLVKANLFVHVERDGKNGVWLYQMAPEFTELMWDQLARSLHPNDLEHFLTNIERSIRLMSKTAEQGEFLYFRLDETSETVTEPASFAASTASAECKRTSDSDTALHNRDAATKRPCCRESTEL